MSLLGRGIKTITMCRFYRASAVSSVRSTSAADCVTGYCVGDNPLCVCWGSDCLTVYRQTDRQSSRDGTNKVGPIKIKARETGPEESL